VDESEPPNPSSRIRAALAASNTATARRPAEGLEGDLWSNLRCSIGSRLSGLDSTTHTREKYTAAVPRKIGFITLLADVHSGLQTSLLYKAQGNPLSISVGYGESIIATSTGEHFVGMSTL
jgi:hypothetical protein